MLHINILKLWDIRITLLHLTLLLWRSQTIKGFQKLGGPEGNKPDSFLGSKPHSNSLTTCQEWKIGKPIALVANTWTLGWWSIYLEIFLILFQKWASLDVDIVFYRFNKKTETGSHSGCPSNSLVNVFRLVYASPDVGVLPQLLFKIEVWILPVLIAQNLARKAWYTAIDSLWMSFNLFSTGQTTCHKTLFHPASQSLALKQH